MLAAIPRGAAGPLAQRRLRIDVTRLPRRDQSERERRRGRRRKCEEQTGRARDLIGADAPTVSGPAVNDTRACVATIRQRESGDAPPQTTAPGFRRRAA